MLARTLIYLDKAMEYITVAIFSLILLVGITQVSSRYLLGIPLSWTEEFQKFGHIWLVFIAIPIAYNRGAHIYMNVLRDKLPKKVGFFVSLIVDLGWLVLGYAIVKYTINIMKVAQYQTSAALEIPMSYVYFGMVIGGAYICIVSLRKIKTHFS